MEQKRVSIITMGCSKNLVDSERVMRMLSDAGFAVDHNSSDVSGADEVIINTCGFIGDAKEDAYHSAIAMNWLPKFRKWIAGTENSTGWTWLAIWLTRTRRRRLGKEYSPPLLTTLT